MNMEKKQNKLLLGLNLFLLVLFITAIVYISIKYAPSIQKIISKPDRFRDFLASYKSISLLVFILMQVIQVVVAVIPGELVQLAGGYVYGTFFGTLYSLTGILMGAVIAFYVSRLLGLRTLKAFIPPNIFDKFSFLMNNPKSEIFLFLLFLIPLTPKDTLVYLAGFTPIKPQNFFLIFIIARFPTILLSSFIGAHIQERNYKPVIIVAVFVSILLVICFVYKDKLMQHLHKLLPSKKNP
jgi:uncharacterized membrane protein YdjX (TVP38/TMEM64 family)